MRKLLVLAGLIVLFTIFLVACDRDKPATLAFVGETTGRASDLGTSGRNGAILAVETINAAGGIKGKPVTLLIRDDQQNPATAGPIMSELANSGVDAIIGPMTSSMALAMTPFANSSETVL
jgi:branched-chain amino acid transport system substrate-binding protein